MDKTKVLKNENHKLINIDKFQTHKGEFIPIKLAVENNQVITTYEDFIDENEYKDDKSMNLEE